MPIAFQPNAFQNNYPSRQAGFQAFDRYVKIPTEFIAVIPFLIIEIGPHMSEYKQGTTITIRADIKDPSQIPSILFNPTSVEINIFDSTGNLKVDLEAMTAITTGIYNYTFQTDDTWILGIYQGNIKAVSGDFIDLSITQELFRLV